MRPVSENFPKAVRSSHDVAVRATILDTFYTGVSPLGERIEVTGGSVKLDSSAKVRGSLDLSVSGKGWSPDPRKSNVTPYGNEVFIERGVVLGGGHVEWVSQGYFRMSNAEQESVPNGTIRITAQDRMKAIVDGQLFRPKDYTENWTVADVFFDLVREVYEEAEISFDWDAQQDDLGRKATPEKDRYKFLKDLADSRGKIMFWDYAGVLQVKDLPDDTEPVLVVNAGEDGTLIDASRSVTREGVYNRVVATGDATDDKQPPIGIAADYSSNSPTYWDGKFGKITKFYSSPLLKDNGAAVKAARTMLAKGIGIPYDVSFSMVPNSALEPLDVIELDYPGVTEVHVIKDLEVPLLESDALSGSTRQRKLIYAL